MALRCVYTDLDGTLLGKGSSLFRDADGAFSLAQTRGLEACQRAGVEVVIMSGRREPQVHECARASHLCTVSAAVRGHTTLTSFSPTKSTALPTPSSTIRIPRRSTSGPH